MYSAIPIQLIPRRFGGLLTRPDWVRLKGSTPLYDLSEEGGAGEEEAGLGEGEEGGELELVGGEGDEEGGEGVGAGVGGGGSGTTVGFDRV